MSNIGKLVVLLIVIFGLIGFLCSSQVEDKAVREVKDSSNTLITINSEKEVYSGNRVVVNDKVVNDGKADNVVVMGTDGEMYAVQSGNVLVSDVVVTADDSKTSVYRTTNQNTVEFN